MPSYPPTAPVKKNRTNAYIIGSAAIAIVAIVTVGVITANSRGDDEAAPTPTVTVTETAAVEQDAKPTEQEAGVKTGDEARNGGAVVKITKVTTSNTITLAGAQKKAGADAKFVTVKTVVINEAKSSMDLTCDLPINNALIDDQGRRFDTVDDLYEVAGNPECNAQLQPGFKDEMLWVYRLPRDAKIASWEFSEYDLDSERTPTLIDLT
ncbi:hypothetical protein CG723_40705 [Streptomyces sp. CB01635]|nr:hypothetical protein CG723_40705 [Streptomyces sp. CB01635]